MGGIGSRPIGGGISGSGSGGVIGTLPGGGGGGIGGASQLCDEDDAQDMDSSHRRLLGFMGDTDDCCCPCAFYIDDFDDDSIAANLVQATGTWTESGDDISTTDSNAILYLCTTRSSKDWGVMASVTLADLEIGDIVRVNVGGVGPRIIGEIEAQDTGGGGSIDTLALTVRDINGDSVATDTVAAGNFTVMMCTGATGVRMAVTSAGEFSILCSTDVSPLTTNRVGIETTTLTGTATFNFMSVEEIDGFDCPCSCILDEDLFKRADSDNLGSGWVEDAGNWEISNEKLVTSDSNARADFQGTSGYTGLLANGDRVVEAEITGTSAGDQVGVYFNVGHAHYIEFASGAGNGKAVTFNIGTSTVISECAVTAEPGTTYTLRVQELSGSPPFTVYSSAIELDGTVYLASPRIGGFVELGAYTRTIVGEARFSSFRVRDLCGPCPPIARCGWVIDPDGQQFKVTLIDTEDSSGCTDLDGEYILDFEGETALGRCEWKLSFEELCGYTTMTLNLINDNQIEVILTGPSVFQANFGNNVDSSCMTVTPDNFCPQTTTSVTCREQSSNLSGGADPCARAVVEKL